MEHEARVAAAAVAAASHDSARRGSSAFGSFGSSVASPVEFVQVALRTRHANGLHANHFYPMHMQHAYAQPMQTAAAQQTHFYAQHSPNMYAHSHIAPPPALPPTFLAQSRLPPPMLQPAPHIIGQPTVAEAAPSHTPGELTRDTGGDQAGDPTSANGSPLLSKHEGSPATLLVSRFILFSAFFFCTFLLHLVTASRFVELTGSISTLLCNAARTCPATSLSRSHLANSSSPFPNHHAARSFLILPFTFLFSTS